jgi:2-dehydro-3-deoxyphosphogalactonate aldolase
MKGHATKDLTAWLRACPVIAILRGVKPDEVVDIGAALIESGIRIIEVPLNSPEPLASIKALAMRYGDQALIGAGTVVDCTMVKRICQAGGQLTVSPHACGDVVQKAKVLDMIAIPGFFTPTEAFAMIQAGADGLKLFPAEAASPAVLKSLRAVLPSSMPVLPVGSINADNMEPWLKAGAAGFGLGGSIYKPGFSPEKVAKRARAVMRALQPAQAAE